ncbi:MAG: hypothetical protein WBH44_11570 [Proteocatella sp.]
MSKRILSIMISIICILTMGLGSTVYADTKVSVKQIKGSVAAEGDTKLTLIVEVENTTGEALKGVKAKIGVGDLTYSPYSDEEVAVGDIDPGVKKTAQWSMNVTGLKLEKMYKMPVTVTDESGVIGKTEATLYVAAMNDEFEPDPDKTYNPQLAITVKTPNGTMASGMTNDLNLTITNIGNSQLLDVVASIGPLGENMSLKDSPIELRLGSISLSKGEKSASFPIYIDKKHEGGNIPFTVTVKGKDPNGKEAIFTKTEYITVVGGLSETDNLDIAGVTSPAEIAPGKDFKVGFKVINSGSSELKNIKVTVEPTTPVVNKTKNTFVTNFKAGESKSFNVTMFSASNTEAKNYPIKITVETSDKEPKSISQYAGVYVKGDTSSKTVPQLMITNYSYGGKVVQANKAFDLAVTLTNTNTKQAIKNIKVSLNAEEGIFIPQNSSNSFYIASIGAGATATKTITLTSKPDAPQKTVPITVDMTYEDKDGNPVTAKDTISIPLVQDLRLVIDEITPPTELYAGQQASVSLQYYNMGKTPLTNLRVTAEGKNLEFSQSPSVYVGNLAAGKNEYYDLSITPVEGGPVEGKVIFSFENAAGEESNIEKEFKFTAAEMPVPEIPEGEEIPEEGASKPYTKYIIGGLILAAIAGFAGYKKHKKKKMDDSLNIEI